jgi:hypothetical protein
MGVRLDRSVAKKATYVFALGIFMNMEDIQRHHRLEGESLGKKRIPVRFILTDDLIEDAMGTCSHFQYFHLLIYFPRVHSSKEDDDIMMEIRIDDEIFEEKLTLLRVDDEGNTLLDIAEY